jgi:hypothetical protein
VRESESESVRAREGLARVTRGEGGSRQQREGPGTRVFAKHLTHSQLPLPSWVCGRTRPRVLWDATRCRNTAPQPLSLSRGNAAWCVQDGASTVNSLVTAHAYTPPASKRRCEHAYRAPARLSVYRSLPLQKDTRRASPPTTAGGGEVVTVIV